MPNRSELLSQITAEYLQVMEAGGTPDRESLLIQYPDLREDLRAFFDNQDHADNFASPPSEAAKLPPIAPTEEATLLHPPADAEKATIPPGPRFDDAVAVRNQLRDFGDYELIEEIARGGMGVVFKARQLTLNRIVALKMILTGELAGEQDVKRFHAEAEAAAQLDHPGIVPIFEVGDHDGQHYFSMAFIEGSSLADKLKDGPLPPKQAAEQVKKISEAVAYAHQKGVIHRDLKPGNVLLDSNGQPKVTDFGLAKRVETDSGLTATGQILGTPSYMPPEQAHGNTEAVTESVDVYSLGALLYALLSGRPPFQADNNLDTLLQVLEKDPVPLRLLNPKIDSDLETICLKCLEKNPDHRYSSATKLAQDLNRYLEGESISIKSLNLVDRLVRALQRSKHDVELRTWGTMLYWFAAILLLAEIGIYIHALDGPPYPKHWAIAIRTSQYLAMGVVLWSYRKSWSISNGAAERQMLSIWIGFFLACHFVLGAAFLMATPERPMDELRIYPFLAIISGLAFFVMGSSYWGQCYAFALAFLGLALLMPLKLPYAPIEFGLLWAICLTMIGVRLRNLSTSTSKADRENAAPVSNSSDLSH